MLVLLVAGLCLAQSPQIAGCPMYPPDNIWNTPIEKAPVARNSARYIDSMGASKNLHPDFGPDGGIPYVVVPPSQPNVPVQIRYPDESDPGPFPIPPNPPIEKGSDNHMLILQQGTCMLYELFAAKLQPTGWSASSTAVFDLRSNALRPDGWTSADAAGHAILPGLVRYEEVAAGEIRHALRMTAARTRREYVWPARHYASNTTDSQYPPMGQRFRLKASYDISGFPSEVQVILRSLKKYGAIISDNGSSWFLTGAEDPRWNVETMAAIKTVLGSDMEAVDASYLQAGPNSGAILSGASGAGTAARNTVAFSDSPVFDLSSGNVQSITMTGDVPSPSITGLVDGQTVSFLICQDSTGGHVFAWPPNVLGGMSVGLVPNKCSAQQFVSDGNRLYATGPGAPDM
jgi:hypothetical protein